jgi:hypothetical protein
MPDQNKKDRCDEQEEHSMDRIVWVTETIQQMRRIRAAVGSSSSS